MAITTRGTIVSEAAQLLGNPDIGARLNAWLNFLLRYLHQAFGWEHLKKQASGSLSATTATLAFPADFRASSPADLLTMQLKRSADTIWHPPLQIIPIDRYWEQTDRDSAATTNEPEAVAVDLRASVFRLYRTPDQAYNYSYLYYYLPADLSSDSSSPTLPLDWLLTMMLVEIGAYYEQDNRFVITDGVVERLLQRFMRAHHQGSRRHVGGAVPLDPAVFLPGLPDVFSPWDNRK